MADPQPQDPFANLPSSLDTMEAYPFSEQLTVAHSLPQNPFAGLPSTAPTMGTYPFSRHSRNTIDTHLSTIYPAPTLRCDMCPDEGWTQPPGHSYPALLLRPEHAQDTNTTELSVRPRIHAALGKPVIAFEVDATHGGPAVLSAAWTDITAALMDHASKMTDDIMESPAWQQTDESRRSMTHSQAEAAVESANKFEVEVARELCSRPSLQGIGSVIFKGPRMLVDRHTGLPFTPTGSAQISVPSRTLVECGSGLDGHGFELKGISDQPPAASDDEEVFLYIPSKDGSASIVLTPRFSSHHNTSRLKLRPQFYHQALGKVGVQRDITVVDDASQIVSQQWSQIWPVLVRAGSEMSTAIEGHSLESELTHHGRLLSPEQALFAMECGQKVAERLGPAMCEILPILSSVEIALPGFYTNVGHLDEVKKRLPCHAQRECPDEETDGYDDLL